MARRSSTRWLRIPKKLQQQIAKRNGMTETDLDAALAEKPKRAKYGNRQVSVGERTFDSSREARRYLELALLQASGEIADLECQPAFELHAAGGKKVGIFTPDFRYRVVATGEVVVEDVKAKPTRTEAYMLRKRWLEAEHGIRLQEIY